MKPPSILITGFKPFLGEALNPSALLLEKLAQNKNFKGFIRTQLLPVVFKEAVPAILDSIQNYQPDMVLMMGQASGRSAICLERVGLNWIETAVADESGWIPDMGPIAPHQSGAAFTDLPIEIWKNRMVKEGHLVEISLSAGGYVCNYLYYSVLQYLEQSQKKRKACFIHVPYLPEQTVRKEPVPPCMELETQYQIICRIVEMALE